MFAGFLFQHLNGGMFWIMALLAVPAIVLRPAVVAR